MESQKVWACGMRPLIIRDAIADRVKDLAYTIRHDIGYQSELTVVVVLDGAFMFAADLLRQMAGRVKMEFIGLSSYTGTEQGPLLWTRGIQESLKEKDVLVVEDILDSGKTLRAIGQRIRAHQPRSYHSVVLLRKLRKLEPPVVEADYVGFNIPDQFVVGYGLDADKLHRNLPEIWTMEEA